MAANDSEALQLPLYGRIAAGTPIEALRDHSNYVDVPAAMMGSGEHYALEVDGDSMIDAGILDGDTVVIERCDTAENGTIVVALIDNEEARSEEHTSELQSLMRISYAVFCLNKQKQSKEKN